MQLKNCLLTNIHRDNRLKSTLDQFATNEDRLNAWAMLPEPEQRKYIRDIIKYDTKQEKLVYDEAGLAALREVKKIIETARRENWYPDSKELVKYVRGVIRSLDTYIGHTDTLLEDKIIDMLYWKIRGFVNSDRKDSKVDLSGLEYMRIPHEDLIRAMDQDRLQDFLHAVMKRYFSYYFTYNDFLEKVDEWRDMYRRRCLRFLDPSHQAWQVFGVEEKDEKKTRPSQRHRLVDEFEKIVMDELTRPPPLGAPELASSAVLDLHDKYKEGLTYLLKRNSNHPQEEEE